MQCGCGCSTHSDTMCRVPIGKVIKVEEGRIVVACNGKTKVLESKLVKVGVGDYVEFAGSIAIDKMEKEEAEAVTGSG